MIFQGCLLTSDVAFLKLWCSSYVCFFNLFFFFFLESFRNFFLISCFKNDNGCGHWCVSLFILFAEVIRVFYPLVSIYPSLFLFISFFRRFPQLYCPKFIFNFKENLYIYLFCIWVRTQVWCNFTSWVLFPALCLFLKNKFSYIINFNF